MNTEKTKNSLVDSDSLMVTSRCRRHPCSSRDDNSAKSSRAARISPGARLCARSTSRSRLATGDASDSNGCRRGFGAAAAGPRRTQPRSLGCGFAARCSSYLWDPLGGFHRIGTVELKTSPLRAAGLRGRGRNPEFSGLTLGTPHRPSSCGFSAPLAGAGAAGRPPRQDATVPAVAPLRPATLWLQSPPRSSARHS